MLQAKIKCPHCGKPIVIQERQIDPKAMDKVDAGVSRFFRSVDKAFDDLSAAMSKIKFTK